MILLNELYIYKLDKWSRVISNFNNMSMVIYIKLYSPNLVLLINSERIRRLKIKIF